MPPTAPSPSASPARSLGPWAWASAVLVLCLGATASTWTLARKAQERRDEGRLHRFINRTERSLQNRLGRVEDLLMGAQGFLAQRTTPPTPAQWRQYVGTLELAQRHPGLLSLAVIRPVPASQLDAYLAEHPQLAGRYHRPVSDPRPLLPADGMREHYLIELCEPERESHGALGLDVGAGPSQRQAAELSRATGRLVLSSLLHFTRQQGRENAVAYFAPLYAGPAGSDGERLRQHWGWVSAGLLVQPMVEDLLRGEDPGLALRLVDVTDPGDPQTLYADPEWSATSPRQTLHLLGLGGRRWQLAYAAKPGFYRVEGRNQPVVLLLGGLVISLSLSAVVWSLAGLRLRAEAMAQAMNQDLSEALERTRSHLENTPLAIIETDDRFRIREWNPAAERIFGYRREEALGKDPRMLVPPEGQDAIADRRQALLAAAGGTRITIENLTSRGQRILCDWYNTALRDASGRLLGAIFLADDVTDRRRAEGALRQAQKLESLGVLAGGIAHDFNNLLTAILGNTEVALARAEEPALKAALQRIESTTQRGSDLARQLLAYAGKAHFAVRPLDLNAIILEMGDLLSVSISKKVALRQDLQPGLPPVEADSAQFQQVVMNLVINASEAIGERAGTVTLRTRAATCSAAELSQKFPGQVLEPGTYVRLEVEDDGVGMDAETIGRIFDPFFTTKFTGRGLGLSAMLGIVRGHRAGIRVESVPGRGTTFILLFPATDATVVLPAREPAVPRAITGTVLVVDDEAIIRDLARSALESSGFRVLEARDGLDALDTFTTRHGEIDLVLLDMTMPRMGGAETFRQMRQISPGVKILLTSGYTQRESLDSLADLPPNGFLQKPFRVKELVSQVRDLLRDPGDSNAE